MNELPALSQPPASAAEPGAGEPRVGDVLAERYLVLGELGRGSLGVVLEGENLQTGKRVALKWLSAARAGEAARERFVRFQCEGRAIAQIWHPHVVDVQDLGECDGTPFLVTERLYGETLRARLARGPLSWREARRVLAAVLQGLSVAHRAGVVHRELKPENVFLCIAERGRPPVPKLLDFAIACLRPAPDAVPSPLDAAPPAVAAYLAPEQLTGEPADARCDIYAAGVVLYEALTGQLPFQARSAAELAVLQATTAPARPSSHAPALRGVPERVLSRALRAAPPARYPDAAMFAAALAERPRAAGAGLAETLGAAALLAGAAYALYLEHGWNEPAHASDHAVSAVASTPALPVAELPPAAAPATEDRAPPTRSRAAPPKPSKRWIAYHLAVTRGAEATRALEAELAAKRAAEAPPAAPGEPAQAAVPQNPYGGPAAQPKTDL